MHLDFDIEMSLSKSQIKECLDSVRCLVSFVTYPKRNLLFNFINLNSLLLRIFDNFSKISFIDFKVG